MAGCGAFTALPSPAEGTPTATPTPTTTDGYVYTDNTSAYAVTFPNEPEVERLDFSSSGYNQKPYVATYLDPATNMYYLSRGEISDRPVDLRTWLLDMLATAPFTDGQIGASSYELGELPAVRGEVTTTDGQELSVIAASGEGNRVYLLLVEGGTAEERDVFFDSFEYLA